MGSNINNKHNNSKQDWQLNNIENNPCFKEQNLSLKCIDENDYDMQMCIVHFENYNNCKKFWNAVKRNRRINGVRPLLPPLEERITIKENYMRTGKL